MNFTFERLSESNIHHLVPLHYALYGKRLPVAYFLNKYKSNYTQGKMFGCFAFHQQKAVAFEGMSPYVFQYKGHNEMSLQSVDSMTHPAYTKRDLFKMAVEKVYESLSGENISFLWGFANEGSFKSFTRNFNWQHAKTVNGYCIPVNSRYASWLKRKANSIYYGDRALVAVFENEIVSEYPINSLGANGMVTTLRDADYYNYKAFGGSIVINLKGVKIWLKADNSLFIGDMDNISAVELKQLLPVLVTKARQCGVQNIYFQSNTGSQIEAAFNSLYPKFESWKVVYDNINSKFPLDKIALTMGDLDSF